MAQRYSHLDHRLDFSLSPGRWQWGVDLGGLNGDLVIRKIFSEENDVDNVYEFFILHTDEEGCGVVTDGGRFVVARTEDEARMFAAREIPEGYAKDLSRIRIILRKFVGD